MERGTSPTERMFATVHDQSLEREFAQWEVLRLEVQRLASRQEYKDRELANLKHDIKRKEQTFLELLEVRACKYG